MENLDILSLSIEELDNLLYGPPETNECELTVARVTAVAYDVQIANVSCRFTPKVDEYTNFDDYDELPTSSTHIQSRQAQMYEREGYIPDDDEDEELDNDSDDEITKKSDENNKYQPYHLKWRERYIRKYSVKSIPEMTSQNELRDICGNAVIKFPMINLKGSTWYISTTKDNTKQNIFLHTVAAHMIQISKAYANTGTHVDTEGKTVRNKPIPGVTYEIGTFRAFRGYCDRNTFTHTIADIANKIRDDDKVIGEYHERVLCCLPMLPFLDCDVKRANIPFEFQNDRVLIDTIVSLIDIGWAHANIEMGVVGAIAMPNVYCCARKSKVSLHVHGKRNGYICRDITYLAKFIGHIQTQMRMISETHTDEMYRNVAAKLGDATDGWIDGAMISTKREGTCGLRMPFSPKPHKDYVHPQYIHQTCTEVEKSQRHRQDIQAMYDFSAQLKLWDRKTKNVNNCAYDPTTFIIQPYDFIWDEHAYGSTAGGHNSTNSVDIADPELRVVVAKFLEKFPEYEASGRNGPHAAMIFNRIATSKCKAHAKDHCDRQAFVTRRAIGDRFQWQLVCDGHSGESARVISTLPCHHVVEHTSTTSVIKYLENATVGDWEFMYGDKGAIKSWPKYSLDTDTPEGKFWDSDTYIGAPFGSGKTTGTKALVDEPRKYSVGILMITSRVSFSAKLCKDFGFISYKDIDKMKKFDPVNNRKHRQVVCQFESLHKVMRVTNLKFKFSLVIIDEPCALFTHMFNRFGAIGSSDVRNSVTVGKQGVDYFALLESALSPANARKIVVMDNDLSDMVIDVFRSIRREKAFEVYINTNKRYSHVQATIDSTDESDCRVARKIEDFVEENIILALDDKPYSGCVVSVHRKDVKKEHKIAGTMNIERRLKDKIAEICSERGITDPDRIYNEYVSRYDGNADDNVKDKDFSDVNAAWGKKVCVIYNQTVSVGISFDAEKSHFTDVFGIFQNMWNSITPESTVQSLFRIRSVQRMHLAVKRRSKEEWGRCKYPVTNMRDIAKFIYSGQILYNNVTESTPDLIAPSSVLNVINSTTSLPYTAEGCMDYITNRLGSSVTTHGWVYNQLLLGRGMIDPVGCVDILLKSAGVQITHVTETDDAMENEIFIAANRKLQKKARDNEYIQLRDDMNSLIEGTHPEGHLYKEFSDIVLKCGQELDAESTAKLISDDVDKTRNWRRNEKDMTSLAMAAIYNSVGQDRKNITRSVWISYTANRVKTARSESVARIMKFPTQSKLGPDTRKSIVLQDGTQIMDAYIGMILSKILNYNPMEVEDRVCKSISRDELLSEENKELFVMLANVLISRNYALPAGFKIRKSQMSTFNADNVKQLLSMLNFYLQFIGASIASDVPSHNGAVEAFNIVMNKLRATDEEIAERKKIITSFVKKVKPAITEADTQWRRIQDQEAQQMKSWLPMMCIGNKIFCMTSTGMQCVNDNTKPTSEYFTQ